MDVRTLCLGVLSQAEASGYEIKKAFEEGPLAHIHTASFGSIYPALNALLAEGLVEAREIEQDKRPDKRIYSITPRGEAAFAASLLQPPSPDKVRSDFLFMFYFAQCLPVEHLAAIIDRRIAWYEDCLARMEACSQNDSIPAGGRFVRGLGQVVYRAAADYLITNRDALLEEVALNRAAAAE